MTTLLPKFSRLTRQQRLQQLQQCHVLTASEALLLRDSVSEDMQDLLAQYAENVIGGFPLPFGLVPEFPIDQRLAFVPMVTEETSVIAAVNKTAQWIRRHGQLNTRSLGQEIIGQIQIAKVNHFAQLVATVEQHAAVWIAEVHAQIIPTLVKRGGGISQLMVRQINRPDGAVMAVIHVLMNSADAMGANLINQVCEFLRAPIEQASGEKITMCILSNLTEHKLVEAQVILDAVEPMMAERIVEAGLFAECDPYRAATHNKGVMNGIDAVLVATGNDWRAVEAGIHAYAARSGQYRAVTHWQYQHQQLIGTFTGPLMVGTVGGVTRTHPLAKLALKLSHIHEANELARLAAAVGLVQNLAALRALTNEGIVQGHMKLHLQNLLMTVAVSASEQHLLHSRMQNFLQQQGKITASDVAILLKNLRTENLC